MGAKSPCSLSMDVKKARIREGEVNEKRKQKTRKHGLDCTRYLSLGQRQFQFPSPHQDKPSNGVFFFLNIFVGKARKGRKKGTWSTECPFEEHRQSITVSSPR